MKRSLITYVTASLLVVVFLMMMFAFQVRQTEIAIVTVFGRYSGAPREPGIHFRLPWPVESVHRFDNRIRNFEKKYEPTSTRDGRLLMTEVFVGWRIAEPKLFLERFSGDVNLADIRRPKYFGAAPYNEKIAAVDGRTWVVEVEVPSERTERETLGHELQRILEEKTAQWGITVQSVEIRDVHIPQALEDAMRADRAPYKILQFNDFGLVAITRKRVKQSLERALCSPCPYCEASGYVKSVGTVISEILAQAQKYAKVVDGKECVLRVNPEVAHELQSTETKYLEEIEEILGRPVLVISDTLLHQEKFDLT